MFPSLQGPDFCIAHEDFLRLVLPSLTDKDFVLLLYTHSGEIWQCLDSVQFESNIFVVTDSLPADDVSEVVKLARRVRGKTSNLHAVYHRVDGDTAAAAQQVAVCLSVCLCGCLSVLLCVSHTVCVVLAGWCQWSVFIFTTHHLAVTCFRELAAHGTAQTHTLIQWPFRVCFHIDTEGVCVYLMLRHSFSLFSFL